MRDVGLQDREFLSTEPSDHIAIPHTRLQPLGDHHEQIVSDLVAEAVVDHLEAIDFERFIDWTHEKPKAGTYACFAVVPQGMDTAIGIFQVRALGSDFQIAEWGFALGSPFWGRGLFVEGATLVLQFAFDELGVHRLEARSSVENGRGIGALRKVRAVPEGMLRRAFLKDGRYHDQILWSILADDWRRPAHLLHDSDLDVSDTGLDSIVEPLPQPARLH